MTRRILALVLLLLPGALCAEERLGYYRFPAIHGDTIVFAAEGDLWRVDRRGGIATRLTTHPAEESNPAISPDGKTLAFSAAYEGPLEVYTMPVDGGLHGFPYATVVGVPVASRGRMLYLLLEEPHGPYWSSTGRPQPQR